MRDLANTPPDSESSVSRPPRLGWSPDLLSRATTRDRLDAIAFTPMSVKLRNELITETYGDLAVEMAVLLDTADATWVTVGQWASSAIGGYLRWPIPVLGRMIARAFGDGNRDVFADIGRAHTTFLATVGAAVDAADPADRQQAVDEAWPECERQLRRRLVAPPGRPGAGSSTFWETTRDPRLQPAGDDYNELLVRGFKAYAEAITESSPEDKSRAILLGNSLLALHEQKLLSLAISVGFRSWLRTLTTAWRPLQNRRDWRNQPPGAWRLNLEDRWIRFATQHVITVDMPADKVRVGKPLVPSPDAISVKRCLVDDDDIDSCPTLDMLGMLHENFDVDGRAATNWNNLADRMAFILAMFASVQRSSVWWNDDGSLSRPVKKQDFAQLLNAQMGRMALPPVGNALVSPVGDDVLDTIRGRASHPVVPAGDEVTFASLAEPETHDKFFAELDHDIDERLAAISVPGGLLDPLTCRDARALFSNSATLFYMGLLFRSLPDGFAAAMGVKVLGAASDLGRDPFRRSGETAQFVNDLLVADDGWSDGMLVPGGAAYRSIRGVRGIHALVAGQLLNNGWDTSVDGWPLNQEDVTGAALSFAVPVLEMLEQMGLAPSEAECDTYVRFWMGIGHLLGAPLDVLTIETDDGLTPLTYRQAKQLAETIRVRHHRRSLDGVRLTEALVEGMGDGFPRPLDWLANGLMHAIGNKSVSQLLLVGHGRGRRRSQVVARSLETLLTNPVTARPAKVLVRKVGGIAIRPFHQAGAGRPYRRPKNLAELRDTRPAVGEVATDYWPVG